MGTFTLWSINSAFNVNDQTLVITDQVKTSGITFSMEDRTVAPPYPRAVLNAVRVVTPVNGLNLSIAKTSLNFSLQAETTPLLPLGGTEYSDIIEIEYQDPDDSPGQFSYAYLSIRINPLIYKINYYDSALLDGGGNAKLIKNWTHPDYILSRGEWVSGTSYNPNEQVTVTVGPVVTTWYCLKGIYSAPQNVTPPSEGEYWTAFPYDGKMHVKAAKATGNTTKPTRIWANVYFTTDVSGVLSNPVFYANGNTGVDPIPSTPTGILAQTSPLGTIFTTKLGTPQAPTAYEASLADSTWSTSDGTFYFSFSYLINGVAPATKPGAQIKLPLITEISSSLSSSNLNIVNNAAVATTGLTYNLDINVTGHDAPLVAGTNYANLFYQSSDYVDSFASCLPITTNDSQPIYYTAVSNPTGKTSYQLKFNTPGTYYLLGRPTGDLNKACATTQISAPRALRIVVSPPVTTDFLLQVPSTIPATGTFDVSVVQSNVTPGNLQWTLKSFVGVPPIINFYKKSISSGVETYLGTTNAGSNTNIAWQSGYSYFLRVTQDTPTTATFVDILTLTNLDVGISSKATLTFSRSPGNFIILPSPVTMTQGLTGTITGRYSGLGTAIDYISVSGGLGTLTFGAAILSPASGTSGIFTIPITGATTQNTAGYDITLQGKNGGAGGTPVTAALGYTKVIVNAPTGKPSISTYSNDYPFLCQVTATDNDATVCGGWHDNMKKHKPGISYDVNDSASYSINTLYLTLKDSAGVATKAGQYAIELSTNGTNFTPVLAAQASPSDVNSGDYQTFVHIAKQNSDTYPIEISFNANTSISYPFIYVRAVIAGNYSDAYKIYCIPNVKIVSGTLAALPNHVASIESSSGTFFQVNTQYDGYAYNSIQKYEALDRLYASFPNTPTYITGDYDFLQRGAKSAVNGGSLSFNLFFQTNTVTGVQPLFIAYQTSTGRVLIYRASLNIINKNASALKLSGGGASSIIPTTVGASVTFTATNIDKLHIYRQISKIDPTSYIWVTTTSANTRTYNVSAEDNFVYIVATAGSLVVGSLKYVVVGQGCTLTPTSTFLNNVFVLPTASEGQTYPAGLSIGGIKLPSTVEVTQGGSSVKKTVKNDGSGWEFLSANYGSLATLQVFSTKEIRLSDAAPNSFNFQITHSSGTTDYRLGLKSAVLDTGGLSTGGVLTVVFRANFSDGSSSTCASISRDMPIRAYTYTFDTGLPQCKSCDYFPPSAAGSQQYNCGSGYSSIDEVIINGVRVSSTDFSLNYGLNISGTTLTTGALSTPLKYASLDNNFYGFSSTTYTIYVIVNNTNVTNNKKVLSIPYTVPSVVSAYLPYPNGIGLTTNPAGASVSCYEGDKVYVALKTGVATPPFDNTAYQLVFINGTTVKTQTAVYDPSTKTFSFTVPSGEYFVSKTVYSVGLRHLTTDCVYLNTGVTLISGGPRPSGKVNITQPPEQEPCVSSITINGISASGTDLSAITRVQVYSTSSGTLPNYVGDIAVWNNITPTIGVSGKDLSFTLDNSTKQFPSTITDSKQKSYFVNFYTGSSGNGYSVFEQGVPLTLVSKDPVLIPSQTNPNIRIALTSPPTLYENTLSLTCSSCKDGNCNTSDLSTLSNIVWEDSLGAPLPGWLSLTQNPGGGNNYNKVKISGSPTLSDVVNFTIVASVPYYTDSNGATIRHTHTFDLTLEPTTLFDIGSVPLPDAVHYQTSYTQTINVVNKPSVDCSTLTWSITDRELQGADKALPASTVDSPISLSNGILTWLNVDDPDAVYPVKYVFGVQAVCNSGSIATGVVTLTVQPRSPIVGSITPNYGYFDIANETVTIRGASLYPGVVKFGNEEATNVLVNVTNDAITCIPPTMADIGGEDLVVDVVVYNADSGSSQSGIHYTYQRKRNPIINAIIPPGGTFRGGTKVAIVGANFEPTSTVIIDGVLQPILAVTPTSIIFVTMPHSVGSAVVQVTNSIPPTSTTAYNFAAEPKVSDVQPYNLPAEGGIDVYIIGTDFQPGIRVFLDDYEIPSDRITVL